MGADRPFGFLRTNRRSSKPRGSGLTEIRGPYYTALGRHALADLLDDFGDAIDSLKFAGGSFSVMSGRSVGSMIELCHEHSVRVSTGGFIEYVLTQEASAVDHYLAACKELGFDVVEVSAGFISLPADDFLRLVDRVRAAGLEPKPEVGVQFGAGGASTVAELEAEGTRDAGWAIGLARRLLSAGAPLVMIESEGITENVRTWRTDIIARLADALGLDRLMFEAADPSVFTWYVKNYGSDVNLFVDHSQIVQLECLRQGVWGTKDVWGRIRTYGE